MKKPSPKDAICIVCVMNRGSRVADRAEQNRIEQGLAELLAKQNRTGVAELLAEQNRTSVAELLTEQSRTE